MGMLVAILGTTISPYLFFWQATMEAEDRNSGQTQLIVDKTFVDIHTVNIVSDKRQDRYFKALIHRMTKDVNFGMLMSNLVMFFIILATGTALFSHGIRNIDTVEQAAKALEPVAGRASYLLFAIGVVGTGLLAIPVLCGSLSYIVSETFSWKGSLNDKFYQAKPFYIVIIISLIIGLFINYLGISPIQALLYTSILYGVTAPVIIAIVLHISNNKKIMKQYTNNRLSNILGILTLLLMTVSAVYLIYLQFA